MGRCYIDRPLPLPFKQIRRIPNPRLLLLNEPSLQRPNVGSLHQRPNARVLHNSRLHHKHECEFYAHGVLGVDGFRGEIAWAVRLLSCFNSKGSLFGPPYSIRR